MLILLIISSSLNYLLGRYFSKIDYHKELKQKLEALKSDEQILDFVYNNFELNGKKKN